MKRAFLTFVVAVMLTASLTACTASPSGNGSGTGGNGSGTTQDGGTNSRARGGSSNGGSTSSSGTRGGSAQGGSGNSGGTMLQNGRYYADDDGEVYGHNDGIGSDIRRAAGDVMDGVGNAVNDMTH